MRRWVIQASVTSSPYLSIPLPIQWLHLLSSPNRDPFPSHILHFTCRWKLFNVTSTYFTKSLPFMTTVGGWLSDLASVHLFLFCEENVSPCTEFNGVSCDHVPWKRLRWPAIHSSTSPRISACTCRMALASNMSQSQISWECGSQRNMLGSRPNFNT